MNRFVDGILPGVGAARATIERRLANGGGGTGWSRAWIINFWARLEEGDTRGARQAEAVGESRGEIGMVVEGLTTAPVLRDLSHRLGIELPITEGACRILEGESLGDLVQSLMGRRPRGE